MLEISDSQFFFGIFGLVVAALLSFCYWLGLFTTMEIKRQLFPGGYFYYRNYQGSIKGLGEEFDKIQKDYHEIRDKLDLCFELKNCGIYYDDPYNLADENKFRVTTGLLA